jgi:hypothetical protein
VKNHSTAHFGFNSSAAHIFSKLPSNNKQHHLSHSTTTMHSTMALQTNNMNELIASPRPTKETLSFSLQLCNAPIRRKPSFEYDFHQVQEPSLNLLLPVLDGSDGEQDGPHPMLRPRREPQSYDHFYFGSNFDMPESPMRIPTSENDYFAPSTSSDVSVDSSSYCPMPMALDDDSLSLSDNDSLEGIPFAPSLAHGFEDNVVCQLTPRFRRPAPAIVLQPRNRPSNSQEFVFCGQDLEFPTL